MRKEALRQALADGVLEEQVMKQLVGELDEKLHLLDQAHGELEAALFDQVEAR